MIRIRPIRILFATTVAVGLLGIASRLGPIPEGLQATYFSTVDWTSQPARTTIDRQPSTAGLIAAWNGSPPQTFSAIWTGSFIILQDATYAFATTSDDGSWLYIDDQLVVDNGGNHAERHALGRSLHLGRGVHSIRVKYFQGADQFALDIQWAHGDRPLYAMPASIFTPGRPSFWFFAIGVFLRWILAGVEWLWVAAIVAAAAALARPALVRLGALFHGPDGRWLAAIVAISTVINAIGLSTGVDPETSWRGNELYPIDVFSGLAQYFSHNWFNPYPPLHYYLLTAVYSPILLLDWLGRLSVLTPYWYNVLLLAGRVVSLAAGAGTLLAVYAAGAAAFSKRAGLFAAASLALVVTFVGYSKSTNVDVPCLFWFAVSLVFYLRLLEAPTVRNGALFAAFAALAVCTKDQAYALYLPAPLVLVYAIWRDRRRSGARAGLLGVLIDWRLWSAALVAVATFALGNNVFFNAEGFARHVHWLTNDGSSPYKIFQPTLAGRIELLALTTQLDQQALGWPFFALGLAGTAIALVSTSTRRAAVALLVVVASFYLGFVNVILYNYDRFILPLFVVQAFFVGVALDWFSRLKSPRLLWKQAIVGAIFAYSLLYATTVDVLMLRDSRYAVRDWLLIHVAPGMKIGTIFPLRNRPRLDGYTPVEISDTEGLLREAPEYYVIDADYAHAVPPDSSNWDLVTGLERGTLGYTLVFRYRSPSPWPWLPGADPDLVGSRLEPQVYSALRDINPTFEVYKLETHRPDH